MTTYHAHIITADAAALGDPAIVIVRTDADDMVSETLTDYQMSVSDDPVDVLDPNGWRVVGDRSAPVTTDVEPGYYIIDVKPADWSTIVEHVTRAREAAQARANESDASWRVAIADAMTATGGGTRIAEAAQVARSRVYQIRNEVTCAQGGPAMTWTKIAESTGGDTGHPGTGYHTVDMTLEARGDSYRVLVHEDWGSNQGYFESHGELRALGEGGTPPEAIEHAVSDAREVGCAREFVAQAASELRLELSDAEANTPEGESVHVAGQLDPDGARMMWGRPDIGVTPPTSAGPRRGDA